MDSCIVSHKCGSRQWPGFRSFCFGSFSSSLAPTSREIGAWLLVRPKYPVLVSVICTPTAEQTVSILAMHLAWDFRPGLREGRTSCGRLHPAPGCLSRQTSQQMLRTASRCPDQPCARRKPRSHRLQPHGFHCYGRMLSIVPIAILAYPLQVICRKASRLKIFRKNVGRLSRNPCFDRIRSACCARTASGHAGATLAKDKHGGSGTKGVRCAHFTDQ